MCTCYTAPFWFGNCGDAEPAVPSDFTELMGMNGLLDVELSGQVHEY